MSARLHRLTEFLAVEIIGLAVIAYLLPSSARADLGDELFKLTASDAAEGDDFGRSVAISGNLALVGSPVDDDAGLNSGSAYVFDVRTGTELFKLTADDAAFDDRFGSSVAISGNLAAVGAPYDDDAARESGSAYLFDMATGEQLFKLTATDASRLDFFGSSVGISGSTVIVNSYLFDATTGQQLFKLTPSDFPAGLSGASVAISGDRAIVGAPYAGGLGGGGAAYVFDATTGQELLKVAIDRSDEFGNSVSISNNFALVGGLGEDDIGTAYLFDVTTGEMLFGFTPADIEYIFGFGTAVGIDGTRAVAGSPGDDDNGFTSGAVYVIDVATGQQLRKLTASDAAVGDNFGASVATNGKVAVVGAWGDDDHGFNSGAAYLFLVVPEPRSISLLGLLAVGLVGFATCSRWRKGLAGAHGDCLTMPRPPGRVAG